MALIYASYNGSEQTVALLLKMIPNCSPSIFDSKPVRLAARKNHLGVVKVLLEDDRVKATPKFNKVIRKAQTNNWLDMASLLISDPRTSEYWKISMVKSAKRRISKGVMSLGGSKTRTVTVNPVYEMESDVNKVDLSELSSSTTIESR